MKAATWGAWKERHDEQTVGIVAAGRARNCSHTGAAAGSGVLKQLDSAFPCVPLAVDSISLLLVLQLLESSSVDLKGSATWNMAAKELFGRRFSIPM